MRTADSPLPGFQARPRRRVALLRKQSAPTPVVLTALPSWLDRPAAAALLEAADGYVLQVHSLVRPASPEAMAPLCDPEAAARENSTPAARPGFWVRAGFVLAVEDDRYPVLRREL